MSSYIPRDMITQPEDRADKRYTGLPSPMRKGSRGYMATAYTRDLIKSSIYNILNTRKGERVFLPEFGSRLTQLLFETLDPITLTLAKNIVVEDIQQWERRVTLVSVEATPDYENNALSIRVKYVINVTGQSDELVLTVAQ